MEHQLLLVEAVLPEQQVVLDEHERRARRGVEVVGEELVRHHQPDGSPCSCGEPSHTRHMGLLDGWSRGIHTGDGRTFPTYRKGSGPGVIVIHEIPGLTDEVVGFGDEVVAAGFTVVLPHLFGDVPSGTACGTSPGRWRRCA